MFGPVVVVGFIALICYGFYAWAHKTGRTAGGERSAATSAPSGRVSLITEAVSYVGVVLVLAGGFAAIANRWVDIPAWGHVGILAAATAVFLSIGVVLFGSAEPALQRLVSVAWFVSVMTLAGAVATVAAEVNDLSGQVAALITGLAITAESLVLWLIRKRALAAAALFLSLIVTTSGVIATSTGGTALWLTLTLTFWAFGLVWALLGWRGYVEPDWVTMPMGILLALLAPTFALDKHGWMYAIAIGTAAGLMAVSVPLRHVLLLGIGTVTLLAYVTAMVTRYFADSLGTPAALSLTGALVLVLAAAGARLLRLMKRPAPPAPTAGEHPARDDQPRHAA